MLTSLHFELGVLLVNFHSSFIHNMHKKQYLYWSLLVCIALVWATPQAVQAQRNKKKNTTTSTQAPFTRAEQRMEGYDVRQQLIETSWVSHIPFRSVGPTVMSGRVVDLEVHPEDPSIFYVTYASGGLWKTESHGTSFTPLFQNEAVMTIGDIAVDWENETIWVGSGENNSSRSSYAGAGVYKSTDAGKTWQLLGLEETHHIGRIILHPENPEVAWVAALGHLYSKNEERGVYKTTDGGKTWKKTLFIDDNTGVVDLVQDPENPDVLYAAAWERIRYAWTLIGSGKGSGIYKSTDGGETWQLFTTEESGFPTSEGVGRIGLAVAPSNNQIVYAFLDNQDRREKTEEESYAVTKDKLMEMDKAAFLALADEDINDYLNRRNFPQHYNAVDIKSEVEAGSLDHKALVYYVEDANSLLFDTPVKGAEFYRSDDGGKTWKKTHDKYVDDLVYSYGYYFGNIRVDAQNPDHIYAMGVPVIKSKDGGKTWIKMNDDNAHSDHHAMWINPKRSGHIVLGNDGGINITYDDGETWFKANSLAVGQFYTVNVDMEEPYNIYGGVQDNGGWYGPKTYEANLQWHGSGEYPYKRIMGGDGMQVEIDTRDNATVYTGYQFGNYYRINKHTGAQKYITPKHNLGERPLRFNWQTPIHLSRHNQDVLYMGSNKFHRSLNQGDDFETLSEDLTRGGKKGNVPYGTLTTIGESPLKFGLLYVGSDDGLIHVSKDAGYTWEKIYDSPEQHWVSRVYASHFKEGRVYMSLNGYRWDNFEAMVYVSEDYGKTWKQLGSNLPHEPVNVVKEDPKNENILYVGTDHGAYVSLDRGATFMAFQKGLPAVAVHDLVVHPRDGDLVLGTHGRSFFVANVAHLQALTQEILAKSLHVFDLPTTSYSQRWGSAWSQWGEPYTPEFHIPLYLKANGTVMVSVKSKEGLLLHSMEHKDAPAGMHYLPYGLTLTESAKAAYEKELSAQKSPWNDGKLENADDGALYLPPGEYVVEVKANGTSVTQSFTIKPPRQRPERKPMKKTP